MLNIYVPQTLLADRDAERLVAADLLRDGESVLLFLASYLDFPTFEANYELRIPGATLKGTPFGEPAAAGLRFDLPAGCTESRFSVYRDGVFCGRMTAQAAGIKSKVQLTAATLFKGDYAQIRAWLTHHEALGFERFVLYYNGAIPEILPELLSGGGIAEKDVLLVEWPFSYWIAATDLGPEGLLALHGDNIAQHPPTRPDQHHAQQLMLNHALLLLRDSTEFLGFFDLDEYFKLETSIQLIDLLRASNHDVYIFQSRWAELASARIPRLSDDASFFDAEPIQASDWVPFPQRAKYIARPANILGTGAHIPKSTTPGTRMVRVEPAVAGIYHFHCFSGKATRRNFVNPNGEWVDVAHLRNPVHAAA